jgi:hypothetical protein
MAIMLGIDDGFEPRVKVTQQESTEDFLTKISVGGVCRPLSTKSSDPRFAYFTADRACTAKREFRDRMYLAEEFEITLPTDLVRTETHYLIPEHELSDLEYFKCCADYTERYLAGEGTAEGLIDGHRWFAPDERKLLEKELVGVYRQNATFDVPLAKRVAATQEHRAKATANVGDINSTAKGSGVRLNAGKPPMELVPLRLVAAHQRRVVCHLPVHHAIRALDCLGEWQERQGHDRLLQALTLLGPTVWQDCANVFDYGQRKYKAWNWAKGMPWSVPMACAARHLMKMAAGEVNDDESGLPHTGHVACNIVMLMTYAETYPEGDDRPPEGILGKVNV